MLRVVGMIMLRYGSWVSMSFHTWHYIITHWHYYGSASRKDMLYSSLRPGRLFEHKWVHEIYVSMASGGKIDFGSVATYKSYRTQKKIHMIQKAPKTGVVIELNLHIILVLKKINLFILSFYIYPQFINWINF